MPSRLKYHPAQRGKPVVGPQAARGAAVGYLAAVLTLLLTGSLFLVGRPPLADYVDEVAMPVDYQTTCLRATRHADYTSVWLPVGTPVRNAQLLLRLDSVVGAQNAALNLRSKILTQSVSIQCFNTSRCIDVIHLETDGPGSQSIRHSSLEFEYVSSYHDYGLVGYELSLDGEMHLVRGFDYWLTTTHLCWAIGGGGSGSNSSVQVPSTFTDQRSVYHATTLSGTTGALVVDNTNLLTPEPCQSNGQTPITYLFPVTASRELTWLSMSSRYTYEHGLDALKRRRVSVSLGQMCASTLSLASHTVDDTIWIDCRSSGCQQAPSVTYRTLLGQSNLFLRLPAAPSEEAVLVVRKSVTLGRIPDLLDPEDATFISVMRLLLMLLAAAITFIRSSQASSNSVKTMMRSFERGCQLPPDRVSLFHWSDVTTNALIGLVAIAARAVVVAFMANAMLEDRMGAIVFAEILGSVVSLAHFALRHGMITDLAIELPLTKLGGPMSIVDVACAILLVFSEAPLLATVESFAAVGRLLSALLIVVTCCNLCVFSTAACSMLAGVVEESNEFAWYSRALALSALLWLAQIVSLSITYGCAFARPFAFVLQRASLGDGQVLTQCVFFGVLCAGLPTGNRVVLSFTQTMNERLKQALGPKRAKYN